MPFSQKPFEIWTKLSHFFNFVWSSFQMVGTIAIAKACSFGNQIIWNPVFKKLNITYPHFRGFFCSEQGAINHILLVLGKDIFTPKIKIFIFALKDPRAWILKSHIIHILPAFIFHVFWSILNNKKTFLLLLVLL